MSAVAVLRGSTVRAAPDSETAERELVEKTEDENKQAKKKKRTDDLAEEVVEKVREGRVDQRAVRAHLDHLAPNKVAPVFKGERLGGKLLEHAEHAARARLGQQRALVERREVAKVEGEKPALRHRR
jgi:predicted N-acetyltransferase YhbS